MAAFSTIAAVGLGAAGVASQVSGQNRAVGAARDAAATSDATNRYIYDDTVRRNAFREQTGNQALGQLASLYGLGGSTVNAGGFGGAGSFGNPATFRGSFGTPGQRLPGGSGFTQDGFGGFGGFGGNLQLPQINQSQPPQGAPQSTDPLQAFYDSPDYKLAFNEGQQALEGSAAARGGLLSGQTLKGITQFGQNHANNTFGNFKNSLSSIAGIGQQANQAITNAGTNFANGVGQNAFGVANATGNAAIANGNTIGGLAGFGVGRLLGP